MLRVQIIPSKRHKFLKEFYGCHLWKIYDVLEVHHYRSHANCKVKKVWDEYEIEVEYCNDCNYKGQKTTIKLATNECIILPHNDDSEDHF
jgi:hypothetical protein